MNDVFFDPNVPVQRVRAPVLLRAIEQSDSNVWQGAPLAACLGGLEQVLMHSPSAAMQLDRLIGLDAVSRGKYLVEVCMQAVKERPSVGRYIRGAADALKSDKAARVDPMASTQPAMRPIGRGVSVILRQPNSADAMDMVPAP